LRLDTPTRPSALLPWLLVALTAACAPATRSLAPSPQRPSPPTPARSSEPAPPDLGPLIDDAIARSEEAYRAGIAALDSGDLELAQRHLDDARQALLAADPRVRTDRRLLAAARDLDENLSDLEPRFAEEPDDATAEAPDDLETPAEALGEVSPELGAAEAERDRSQVEAASAEVVYDVPMVVNPQVLAFVDLYQGRWRKIFQASLTRSGRYVDMIHRVFAEEGVPLDLAYLAHVESGFKTRALSRVRAYGMWQFMAATGKNYGLSRTNWIDERADPEKAARAAARYLRFLHEMFGDWHLAMAAYNAGEYKVERAIQATGSRDFWEIARTRHLRPETKNFVPAILAAILVYRSPEKYGFDPASQDPPLETEAARSPGSYDLRLIAQRASLDPAVLKDLNPELRRGVTPPSEYFLKVPIGAGSSTETVLASLPASQRFRDDVHVVRQGETLGSIARRYGCSVAELQHANGIRNPRALRVGTRLTLPGSGDASAEPRAAARRAPASPPGPDAEYVVRSGDNAASIARRYGVSPSDLLAWNGLEVESILYPGQRLKLGATTVAASTRRDADAASAKLYVVKRGDTLYDISRAHDVEVADLCRWNGISARQVLHAGDHLKIYLR
jgi:membrane-bound lytic murein transglycosylase D